MACCKVVHTVFGYPVEAVAVQSGHDWNISVYGGCVPHIGSMSIAWLEDYEIHIETIQRPNHKEAVISDIFAETVAREFKCCATVSCGIHYHNPSKSDIQRIIDSSLIMLQELIYKIRVSQKNVK